MNFKAQIPLRTYSWQRPVLAVLNDPPASPSAGDRYIIGIGTGAWTGRNDDIAHWDGDQWQFTTATTGMSTYNIDIGHYWRYQDGWKPMTPGTPQIQGWLVIDGASSSMVVKHNTSSRTPTVDVQGDSVRIRLGSFAVDNVWWHAALLYDPVGDTIYLPSVTQAFLGGQNTIFVTMYDTDGVVTTLPSGGIKMPFTIFIDE